LTEGDQEGAKAGLNRALELVPICRRQRNCSNAATTVLSPPPTELEEPAALVEAASPVERESVFDEPLPPQSSFPPGSAGFP
jgi:hypothetical protein